MPLKKTKKRYKMKKSEELRIFNDYTPKQDYKDEEVFQTNGL